MKLNSCIICGEEIRTGSKHCSICSKFYCDIRTRLTRTFKRPPHEVEIVARIKKMGSWVRFKSRRMGVRRWQTNTGVTGTRHQRKS